MKLNQLFKKKYSNPYPPEELIENDLSNVDYYLIEGKPEKNDQPGGKQ